MNHFHALNVALQLVEALGPLLLQIAQHDRDLANQLRRAGASVPSCLSEGNQRVGKDKLNLFRIAGGSAAEVRTQMRIATCWGYISKEQAQPVELLADRVVAMTWKLTRR